MLRRLTAFLCVGAIALSMLFLPVGAAERREGLSLQYLTDAIYDSSPNSGIEPSFIGNRHFHRGYETNGEPMHEVTDLVTRTKFTLPGGQVTYLTEDIYFHYDPHGEKGALGVKGVNLTPYGYSNATFDGKHILLTKADGSIAVFDAKGKQMKTPPLKSGWKIYAILSDQVFLVKKEVVSKYGNYLYNAVKLDGTPVFSSDCYEPLDKLSETLIRWRAVPGDVYDLYGERVTSHFNVYLGCGYSPKGEYVLLRLEDGCHLYDSKGTALVTLQIAEAKTTADFAFAFLTEDTLLYKHKDGRYIVVDVRGNELLVVQAEEHLLGTLSAIVAGRESHWGLFFRSGTKWTYYNTDLKECFSIDGDVQINPLEGMFAVIESGKPLRFYDAQGNFLVEQMEDPLGPRYTYVGGVLLQVRNDRYAVCSPDGERLTDFAYNAANETGYYGVINLHLDNGSDYDWSIPSCYELWSAEGKCLNQEPFSRLVYFRNGQSLGIYHRNGKYGILRILDSDDPTFLDAPEGSWYYDSVEYCAANGLFSGTAIGNFSPDQTMTRAMLVTVLWRLEGKPTPLQEADFNDVVGDTWYSEAVAWASENGIVNGVGNRRFDPNGNVTREQIATILHRYAQAKGFEIEATGDLSTYPDGWTVSDYALTAMIWANTAGLINGIKSGTTVTLQPQADATRAQVATILVRFILISNRTG